MAELSPPPSEGSDVTETTNVSGGVNVDVNRDLTVDGDVIGRDKVTQTTNVTQVGMAPEAVRRLIITVGALVFITAFCFFAIGAVASAAALGAFNREIVSTVAAAKDFQQKLQTIQAASPNQSFEWQYTETDLSSYLRLVFGPQHGMGDTGRARFLSSQQVVFRGQWPGASNLPVMAVATIQQNAAPVYRLDSSFVQLLPLGENLGWVLVPNSVLQPLIDQINHDIGTGYAAVKVQYPSFNANNSPASTESPLTLTGITR